jgi:hypothetical protein
MDSRSPAFAEDKFPGNDGVGSVATVNSPSELTVGSTPGKIPRPACPACGKQAQAGQKER